MKLKFVIGSVNDNPHYYKFIPIQILFWNKINVKFICIFIGNSLPDELLPFSNNILLWNKNLHLNTIFLSQNLRMLIPALLTIPDDELVMITDMDILPSNYKFFTEGLDKFQKKDFIYYRDTEENQIYMCYNAAHPSTWKKCFNIYSSKDIEKRLNNTIPPNYNGKPGKKGWYTDQLIMYKTLINYPHLKILKRNCNHLEVKEFRKKIQNGEKLFIDQFTDIHFHRSFINNIDIINNAIEQLNILLP